MPTDSSSAANRYKRQAEDARRAIGSGIAPRATPPAPVKSAASPSPAERLLKLGTRARAQLDPELGEWMREVEKQLAETYDEKHERWSEALRKEGY